MTDTPPPDVDEAAVEQPAPGDATDDTSGHIPALSVGAMLRRDIPPGQLAERAHSLDGAFDELWIVEDLPYAGGIAQMAEVLSATDYATVGHGIAPAPFRNAATLAMEWSALADIHPNRVITGIGHGVPDWMAQIGAAVDSPLTLLRETIEAVRRLLAGDELTIDGRYVSLDGVKLRFPPATAPPVLAGVTGPKSLRLAGAVADGTILPEGHGPQEIANARDRIDQGRAEAGRTTHHHLTVFAAFLVDPDGVEPPPPDDAAGPSWVAMGSATGEVTDRLMTLIDAGIDSLVLVPMGPDPHYQLDIAASQILPDLKERAATAGRATATG